MLLHTPSVENNNKLIHLQTSSKLLRTRSDTIQKREEKRRKEGGNTKDKCDLYLIPISPDVSDYCVYREGMSGYKIG